MNEEQQPTTVEQLEKEGMIWIDLNGEESIQCDHKLGFKGLFLCCIKCGRSAEQCYLDRRLK